MTEILEPAADLDDDSPLALLFAMVDELDTCSEAEQREEAELTAAHHVYNHYGSTLGQALDPDDWSGKVAVTANRLEASATAWLDGGLWLHHTLHISENDGARDVLTLIVPCTCGRGYVDYELANEEDLISLIAGLRRTGGRVSHEGDEDECASIPDPHALTKK
ncbi:hypothetical protein ABZ553_25440 [Streptomyces sparsogenes]|uniref:hypothetical protein n=1 Tax=Streptomyces sparsogenes TaxID=67365 RepID=UPI0033DE1FD1